MIFQNQPIGDDLSESANRRWPLGVSPMKMTFERMTLQKKPTQYCTEDDFWELPIEDDLWEATIVEDFW